MSGSDKDTYDVIIIGAGISGLVCGCYLAKTGMNVLIAEQHFQPGGYCTSFKRQGFTFDAAAHSFGSYREGGIMNKILKELDIDKQLNVRRYEPSDIIVSPDHKICFWSDSNRTVQELQETFPREADGVNNFFRFLLNANPFDLAALRSKTFNDLLHHYFSDERVISLLAFPMLGVGGLPPSLISAYAAATLYTEFFLDGGYYPQGGMQALPDALTKRFEAFGGGLRLSCRVKKIQVKSNKIEGVVLEKEGFIPSRYVVSCCDAMQTFTKLLNQEMLDGAFLHKLRKMKPSLSFFIAYLGMEGSFKELSIPGASIWFMPHYDVENMFHVCMKGSRIDKSTPFLIHVPPDGKSLEVLTIAPPKTKRYWTDNKKYAFEHFLKRIEAALPGLSKHIVYKDAASPQTLYRYTLNYKGAAYGWASTPSQLFTRGLTQVTPIEGLFLSGHWTTQTQGVSGVAYIGYETARMIIRNRFI